MTCSLQTYRIRIGTFATRQPIYKKNCIKYGPDTTELRAKSILYFLKSASATTPSPPKPTSDHGFTPTHGPGPSPTKKRPDLWGRFMHFLLVKSVEGVKPDEHPDREYFNLFW